MPQWSILGQNGQFSVTMSLLRWWILCDHDTAKVRVWCCDVQCSASQMQHYSNLCQHDGELVGYFQEWCNESPFLIEGLWH